MSHRLSPRSPAQEVAFTFNDRTMTGHAGEPLAAALLANGVHLVARSFKYHRPRGIVASGVEEPSALVQIGEGARSTPNLPATQVRLYEGLTAKSQNCYPSVGLDFGAINQMIAPFIPAGFYYKTFMGPGRRWMFYEKFIRRAAGLGFAPKGEDPDQYDQTHRHCDLLIVGAGPAGISATLAAAASGARVILIEQDAEVGGSLLSEPDDAPTTIDGASQAGWLAKAREKLAAAPNVLLLRGTSLFGRYRHNWFAALETLREAGTSGHGVRQRLWKIRAKAAIFATGAIERMLVFANNDRPGVMLAGAVRDYALRHRVAVGRKVVFLTNNDSAYRAAIDCKKAGIAVAGLVDIREETGGDWRQACAKAGIDILDGATILGTRGRQRVSGCMIESAGKTRTIDCDLLAVSGGWTPTIHLHSQLQGNLAFRQSDGAFIPIAGDGQPVSVGAGAGIFDLGEAMGAAADAGSSLAQRPGRKIAAIRPSVVNAVSGQYDTDWHQTSRPAGDPSKCFIDLQNDVTVKDVQIAIREGFEINEHLKRYCGIGMGTDQGKTGNLNALAIAAQIRGMKPEEIGLTRYRQPFSPVTIGAMAGQQRGELYHPCRRLPLQNMHERAGARLDPAGAWKIPSSYPRPGETFARAVAREASAVRSGAALFDLSAETRFEIGGESGLALLDSLYFTPLADLTIGEMRKAMLLVENGMVSDMDRIWRLGADRLLVTMGPARGERQLMLMENARQSAQSPLSAFVTDITDCWASLALVGSRAAPMLAEAVAVDLSRIEALSPSRFLEAGEGLLIGRAVMAGYPRFDVLMSPGAVESVWGRLLSAGAMPAGQAAFAVLRAEAREPATGFEIDGTVNPNDLGWDGIPAKSFIGRRSLERDRDHDQLRRHFVELSGNGLKPGGQVIDMANRRPIGYVTTSVFSPLSGRHVNLALVENGRKRIGDTLGFLANGRLIDIRIEPALSSGDPQK